ncbi:DUF2776 family protein, partial [Pseudomonas aeruginosa]
WRKYCSRSSPGLILICLGMICYSIFSKVWLLALVWRRTCSLANRIPMIPVFTCLFCLFLAAFLAEIAQTDMASSGRRRRRMSFYRQRRGASMKACLLRLTVASSVS